MKKLEVREKIKHTGFNDLYATQLIRTDYKALYQRDDGYYEVFYVKIKPTYTLFNVEILEHEAYPTNEDFGTIAWTYTSSDKAFEKYHALKNNS